MAVIGDGAFPSGIVSEAMNNAGGLRKQLLVVLNDNQMSICPRVGGLGEYLDRLRMNTLLHRLEERSPQGPGQGAAASAIRSNAGWRSSKRRSKPACTAACSSKQLGFRYLGPDRRPQHRASCCKYLNLVKDVAGPVLLHVVTRKGARLSAGRRRSGLFPHAGPFQVRRRRSGARVQEEPARGPTPTWPAKRSIAR